MLPNTPFVTIYDTASGSIVTRCIKEQDDRFLVEYPALIGFKPIPVDGGKTFQIEARYKAITPFQYRVSPRYNLMKCAVRGFHQNHIPALISLHEEFMKLAATGIYDLNPFVPGPAVTLQMGDGSAEDVHAVVATVEPTKPPPAP